MMNQRQYSNNKLNIVPEEDLTIEKGMEKDTATDNECLVKGDTMNIIKNIPTNTANIKKDHSPKDEAMQQKIEDIPTSAIKNDITPKEIALKKQHKIEDIPTSDIKIDISPNEKAMQNQKMDISPNEKAMQNQTEEVLNKNSLVNGIAMKNQVIIDIPTAEIKSDTSNKDSIKYKIAIKHQIKAEDIKRNIFNNENLKSEIIMKNQSLKKEISTESPDTKKSPSATISSVLAEGIQRDIWMKESDQILTNIKEEIPTSTITFKETLLKDKMIKNENKFSLNWDQENETKIVNIFPMPSVIGFLSMSFDHYKPYEFTLTTMTQYTYGNCDPDGYWLYDLDFYLQNLNITVLYVAGPNQKKLIEGYIHKSKIKCMIPEFNFPKKQTCPNCGRCGCSKFKAQNILRCNFYHNSFNIPCSRRY